MKKLNFPIEEILILINKNYTIPEIAKHFNVSRITMGKFLKENNLKTNYTKRKEQLALLNNEEIIEKYVKEKLTIKELCDIYNCSNSAIKKRLKSANVIRTSSEAHTKYPCDTQYFSKIDTMNKAYLLGFICADGFVTKTNVVGIGVKTSDSDVIKFFQKELKSTKPIQYKENSLELRIQNKELADSLRKLGVVENKSLIINIEKVIKNANLSDKQIKAFLLGYFDGDGGIYYSRAKNTTTIIWNFSVTGTYETCNYYKKYFNNVGFFTKRHKDEKNNYTYCIGGCNLIKNALSTLYSIKDELDFFYKRKYNRFVKLLEKS